MGQVCAAKINGFFSAWVASAWLRSPRRSRQGHSNAHASHTSVMMLVNCVSTENRTPSIHHHKSGTYIHTYIHTWIRPTAMLRCRRRDNVIEMHLRLTSLPWCWWVDNRTLIRRTTTYIHTYMYMVLRTTHQTIYIHTYDAESHARQRHWNAPASHISVMMLMSGLPQRRIKCVTEK